MLTGCKDTLFFAFMQAGVPKNRQRAAKIPTLHIEIPNLDIGRDRNIRTFSPFFCAKWRIICRSRSCRDYTREGVVLWVMVLIIPERV